MTSEVGVTRLTTMSGKSPKTSRRRILPEVVASLTDISRTSGNLGEKTWETLDDTDSAFEGADDVWLPARASTSAGRGNGEDGVPQVSAVRSPFKDFAPG